MQKIVFARMEGIERSSALQQHLERAFINQWGRPLLVQIGCGQELWLPPTDVYETDETYIVTVELPGMCNAEINLLIDERSLVIAGIRREQRATGVARFHQMNINYGPFQVEVYLPGAFHADGVETHYEDGFLSIVLPKLVEDAQLSRRVTA